MILEVAILHVRTGMSDHFERSFRQASALISGMPGYISHELHRGVEAADKYLLLVRWETLADHEIGFRRSEPYQQWKALLHHFYSPFPEVEHYELRFQGQRD